MPCRSPIAQYQNAKTGSWQFGLAPPYSADRDERLLNCGVCRDCRARRASEWAIRAYHEAQLHQRNCWITLTYADNPVTLRRSDLQLFFKSMRKAGIRFRYFGCGEYGEKLDRPHYHICLFGVSFEHDRYLWNTRNGNVYYRSPTLEKHWRHGYSEITDLTQSNAKYTAGYTHKKIGGKKADERDPETGLRHYDRQLPDGRIIEIVPEFVTCSLKPGIGFNWIKKYLNEVYPADSVVINGYEHAAPAYYDKICKLLDPVLWDQVVQKRMEYAKENPIDYETREYISNAREANRKRKTDDRNFLS